MDWVFQGNRHGAVAVVFRVKEQFGDLSNMSNVFPLLVQGIPVKSSEALYQALVSGGQGQPAFWPFQ